MLNEHDKYDLVEASCAYWFGDNSQVRSPFPEAIRSELKTNAQREYLLWVGNLTEQDRTEVSDDELVRVFEMFLFAEALKLIGKDDSEALLTIHHPFMPRPGDVVNDGTWGPSRVVSRDVRPKEDEKLYMFVTLEVIETQATWSTEFLLPA